MPVQSTKTKDDGLPDAETKDWGDYGTVIVETGNTGGWVMDKDGSALVDCSEMR